jgi:glutathione S-transferase
MRRVKRRSIRVMRCVILLLLVRLNYFLPSLHPTFNLTTLPGRTIFVLAFLSPTKDKYYPKHCVTARPRYGKALEEHLKSNPPSQNAPFLLGNRITHADLIIYQVCHDEELGKNGRKGLQEYPLLKQFVKGVGGRPGAKKFLGK